LIEFRISGSGTARAGISVDDMFATNTSPVPIPGAIWILGSGLLGLLGVRRKIRE